ncbi:MAG: NmrA/HSCARG family protein [Planctomycetota bacterium]
MPSKKKKILIIGGTGAMGRAVVKALTESADSSWNAIVFTRNIDGEVAKALVHEGHGRVSLAHGNLDDRDSLLCAMRGVDAVFCNTNFWSTASLSGERDQGIRALNAAKEAGVDHFIYSSLDAVASRSGGKLMLPHYDAKAAVEHEIDWRRSDEYMRQASGGWYSRHVSVLVTAPYFENFQSIFLPEPGQLVDGTEGLIFRGPLSGESDWQMVGLEDIGFFTKMMLDDRPQWGGRTLRIASDQLPMSRVVADFIEVTGIPAEYRPPTLEEFAASGIPNAHDVVNNFRLYREGYAAPRDYQELRRLHPGLRTWKDWLRETGWRGETRLVQKDPITGEDVK